MGEVQTITVSSALHNRLVCSAQEVGQDQCACGIVRLP